MTPSSVAATYRRMLQAVGEDVVIRQYVGTSDSTTEATVRARVMEFSPDELVGPIVQGDRKLIVLADDVLTAGVTLTMGQTNKIVVRGKELQIKAIDDNTRRLGGVLIAYELRVGG